MTPCWGTDVQASRCSPWTSFLQNEGAETQTGSGKVVQAQSVKSAGTGLKSTANKNRCNLDRLLWKFLHFVQRSRKTRREEGGGKRRNERRKKRERDRKRRERGGETLSTLLPQLPASLERGDSTLGQQPSEVSQGCLVSELPWAAKELSLLVLGEAVP